MIDGLVAGRVYGQPQSRNDANGKPYAFGKVRAATKEGDSLFVSVIVFGDAVGPFLALGDGDSVALAGSLTPKAWTDKATGEPRAGLDMQVHQVLSIYQLQKKRQQAQE
ncbi:MAG: single-stranded DNA-binding protein [Brachymonas sp.]